MYGLTYKFNVDRGELTALKQDVLAVGSVAVGYLTIETSLAEGQIMEVTFGKFNASKFTVITPALGFECVNIEPETWQMPMPDILFAEDGGYAFSLAVKSPVIKSDGTTDYTVLTTTQAGFTVNKSGAVVAHNPLTPTEVDAINAEIANISKRLSTVESKVTNTVIVDFSIDENTGIATIIYNNGTTKTVQLPLERINATFQTGMMTVLDFTAASWTESGGEYMLAFGSSQTGQDNKNFIVQICKKSTATYKVDTETVESEKNGEQTLSDTVFKGSDGSILLTASEPYIGTLYVLKDAIAMAIVQTTGTVADKAMSQKAVTDELNKKISNPTVSGDRYNLVTFNGKESGVLPYTNEPTPFAVVQRDANGRAQVEEGVGEKDIVNISQLADYEETPHYELIEKIITGYSLLTAEPEDFAENYANYYKTNGKARNDKDFAYVALTETEPFETGKYYSKSTESSRVNREKEPDGTDYAFRRMCILLDAGEGQKFKAWEHCDFYSNRKKISPMPNNVIYFGDHNVTYRWVNINFVASGNSSVVTSLGLTSENYMHGNNFCVSSTQIYDGDDAVCNRVLTGDLISGATIYIYGVRK